jgi:SHS2 domain-containing protein
LNANRNRGWRVIDHTADIGLEVWGEDLRQLFERAADALFAQIADRSEARPTRTDRLAITGIDWPDVMFNFLRELFYLWAGRQRLVTRVRVRQIAPYRVGAEVNSAQYDPAVHGVFEEIKAVTYHQLTVESTGAGWRACIYLDV